MGHPALADPAFARATVEVLLAEGLGLVEALLGRPGAPVAAPLPLLGGASPAHQLLAGGGGRRLRPARWHSGGIPAVPPLTRRMDMKAYVLIETAAGKTKAVKKSLAKVKSARATVDAMDAVTGPYDFIAVVDGSTLDAIGNLVTESIGTIDGVTRTTTCVAVSIG